MFDLEPHVALLALAGRLPEGWLAIVREALAGSDRVYLVLTGAVARTFDGASEEGGPWSEPSHELMADVNERQRLLDFMAGEGPL